MQPTNTSSPIQRTQGQCLRREREAHGWSQSELARRVGVSIKTVKRWEGNKTAPQSYAGRKLGTVLEKSEEELALGKLKEEPESHKPGMVLEKSEEEPESREAQRRVLPTTMPRRMPLFAVLLVLLLISMSIVGAFWAHVVRLSATTSSLTPLPASWHQALSQSSPYCQRGGGALWYVHAKGTRVSCQDSGLVMQQISNHYAEMDLMQVNGHLYSQTAFRVQVQVTFQKPGDLLTVAALLVQTPTAPNAIGGYIFLLNPAGYWQLQDVESATALPMVMNGSTTINPSQPTTLTIEVHKGVLYGTINGHRVVSSPDQANPSPGGVGLMIERNRTFPSSPVLFSNFELDL